MKGRESYAHESYPLASYLRHLYDPVAFARERLGFEPDEKQALVLAAETRCGMLNCSRQWGKSTVTAAKAAHRALFRPESLVIVVSPTERQSSEFLRKAGRFLGSAGVRARGDGGNRRSILLPNRSRIVALPGVESNIRGFSAVSLLLVDEAARVRDELYKALRPMLAVGEGDLWLMSTPFGQRGFFWETWEQGGAEWMKISVPATECPRISARFLEQERAALGDRWFRQEYLCEFTQADDAAFDAELLRDVFYQ